MDRFLSLLWYCEATMVTLDLYHLPDDVLFLTNDGFLTLSFKCAVKCKLIFYEYKEYEMLDLFFDQRICCQYSNLIVKNAMF